MNEANRERLRTIWNQAASGTAASGTNERRIGDLYSACMDTGRRESLGLKPLQPELDAISKLSTREELKSLLVRFGHSGGPAPFAIAATQDMKNASQTIGGVFVQLTSQRDRDFYFRKDERSNRFATSLSRTWTEC
jgi:predicted metalloendopeptidase